MNKLILAIGVLMLTSQVLFSYTDKKNEFRKMLINECIETGDKQFTDSKVAAYFHQYCECSSEKLSENMSREEFTKMKEANNDAELQAKIRPIVQSCLDDLQRKMNASK